MTPPERLQFFTCCAYGSALFLRWTGSGRWGGARQRLLPP